MDSFFRQVSRDISSVTGKEFVCLSFRSISGGCIHSAYCLDSAHNRYFVKTNTLDCLSMFEVEMKSLQLIASTNTLRVPVPICVGSFERTSYLVLEYIEFANSSSSQNSLGTLLAKMHKHTSERFGWNIDNVIGRTPQLNAWKDSWCDFYRENRLIPQLQMAKKASLIVKSTEKLLAGLECFFIDYNPPASLLHGDLWGGNVSRSIDGEPVIFDPACYYGDRESDLAFTYMFGGFSRDFYDAYNDVWPLDDGFSQRKILYNLYHELNHFNLFGGSYGAQAQSSINQLVSWL